MSHPDPQYDPTNFEDVVGFVKDYNKEYFDKEAEKEREKKMINAGKERVEVFEKMVSKEEADAISIEMELNAIGNSIRRLEQKGAMHHLAPTLYNSMSTLNINRLSSDLDSLARSLPNYNG